MVAWLLRCFGNESAKSEGNGPPGQAASSTPAFGVELRSSVSRNVLFDADIISPASLLQSGDEDNSLASLEQAKDVIAKLKARLRELEALTATAEHTEKDALGTHPSRPADALGRLSVRKGSEGGNDQTGGRPVSEQNGTHGADTEGTANVEHFFQTYDKAELVKLLRASNKPAAAALLQAVCEEDSNVPSGLLLDVDPALAEALTGAPELVAAVRSGHSLAGLGQLPQHDALPAYLRLRLYMLQAWAARPILAHANAAARLLFEARSDRQLQLMLEAQLMQDAMMGMLLQELLDELLTAPVQRDACTLTEGGGHLVLHGVSHFVNTNNPKVFPFVPVRMRGCGYKKSSGEVVPCVIMEFSPDSNQGAFLEHLQRDYTMMGRMSAIVTLFTLKGEVLHQNAGSIAYYGYQKSRPLQLKDRERDKEQRQASRLHAKRAVDWAASSHADETPVLNQLFQYAPPDTLEGLLESMVQGSVWKNILPVPSSLANAARPHLLQTASPEPDPLFTADANALFSSPNLDTFTAALRSTDRLAVSAFEGSFGLARSNSKTVAGSPSGASLGLAARALKAVPEQGVEEERTSLSRTHAHAARANTGPEVKAAQADARAAATSKSTGQSLSERVGRALGKLNQVLPPKAAPRTEKSLRRSTTYTAIPPTEAIDGGRPCNSAIINVGSSMLSFTAGSAGSQSRLARLRRRSGLDDTLGDALSQSTWGLLGSTACEARPTVKDGAGEHLAEQGPRPSSSTTAKLLVSSLALEPQQTPSADKDAGGTGGRSSGTNTLTASQPSLSPSTSQTPLWPLQQPQCQAAGSFQSPPPSQSQQPSARFAVRQRGSQSPASDSPLNQSPRVAAAGDAMGRVVLDAAAAVGMRTDAASSLLPAGKQASVLHQQISAVLSADVPPVGRSMPHASPSTGFMVSPQPSTGQYMDNCMAYNSSNGQLSASRLGSAATGAALVPVTRSHTAATSPVVDSLPGNTSMGLSGASIATQGAETQPGTAGGAAPASLGSGAHAGAANSGSTTRFRRAPMRQSERSNPSLQLQARPPAATVAHVRSATNVGSTSFSFGSRGPSHRPLVRMMSFLNAPTVQQMVNPGHPSSGPNTTALDRVSRTGSGRFVGMAGLDGVQGGLPSSGRGRGAPSPAASLLLSNNVRRASLRRAHSTLGCSPSETGGESSGQGFPPATGAAVPGAAGEQDRLYHEVTATPFTDPVTKSQAVMVVQTDVTARVRLERRLAEVMEAEHKLLENIFPRHVLEHIAASSAANSSSASQFNLQMLSVMPDPTKTATDHEQVTILFADIVGFTSMCKEVPAKTVMKFLNDLYTRFDTLLDIYGVYKVETIGDCYMVAGGLISRDADGFVSVRTDSTDTLQAWRVVSFAKAMLRDAQKVLLPTTKEPVKMRVGIHTGPVVSGIVGARMPRFCLFGDTINTASRMESTCPYGRIQVSAATRALLADEDWEPTGGVQVKGKGVMETYLLRVQLLEAPNPLASAYLSVHGGEDNAQPGNRARAARRKAKCSAAGASTGPLGSVADLRVESLGLPSLDGAKLEAAADAGAVSAGAGAAPVQVIGRERSSSGKHSSFLFNTIC